MFQKKCDQCQSDFLARRRIDCYCSEACRAEGSAQKARVRAARWREANPDRFLNSLLEWRRANPDKARRSVTDWHKAHPEKRSEQRARWRANHAEQIKKSKAEWHKRDPDRGRMYQQQRRTKKAANGGSFTSVEWQALKERYEFRCLCCHKREPEIELTIDHVVPVTRGGPNAVSNIQPLCLRCNLSKGTKIIDYR